MRENLESAITALEVLQRVNHSVFNDAINDAISKMAADLAARINELLDGPIDKGHVALKEMIDEVIRDEADKG